MRIVTEQSVEQDVNPDALRRLRDVLGPCDFADVCCIGAEGGPMVYLRCPGAPHGVIVDTRSLDSAHVRWIVDSLAASASLQRDELKLT